MQTILILNREKNNFFSVSSYYQFKPIGYPDKTGAILRREMGNVQMKFASNNDIKTFQIPINYDAAFTIQETQSKIEKEIGIENFLKISSANIPDTLSGYDIVPH